jgi:hypothetical protein
MTDTIRLTVFGTDPDNGARTIIDIAEGPRSEIDRLIALHDYRVGAVDRLWGESILEVLVEEVTP